MLLNDLRGAFRSLARTPYVSPESELFMAWNPIMSEQLTPDRIIEALREMPPDATVDDAIERLEAGVGAEPSDP